MSRPRSATRLLRVALAVGVAVAALWLAGDAAAQTGTVTGVVTNAGTGETVAGAQISIPGTGIGTLTNSVGRYILLNVPAGQQNIRAEFIGFGSSSRQIDVPAGGSVVADFRLRSEAISLDAVVVTGTAGAARKKEIGNSIAQINSAEIESAPISDVGDILQGRATGVTVLDNTGMVGAGNTIRLRGNNSVSQGNSPLIYVDGVRIRENAFPGDPEPNQSPSPLQDINPNDIERIEVVKGAAATTLYGTEAAGGVIQIFTKRGSSGAAAWSLNVDQGLNTLGHVGPDKDVNPTGLGLNVCNSTSDPLFPADPGCPESGSWLSNGHIQRYNLSVRGGTDVVNYFVSGAWNSEEGVLPEQGATDYSIRGNFGFSPTETLNIRFNNAFSHKSIDWIPDGNNAEGLLLNVFRGPADYTPNHDDSKVLEMKLNTLVDHFTTGMNVTWTPGNGMTHRVNAGLDYSEADYTEERPFEFFRVPAGDREVDRYTTRKITLDYAGSWNISLGDQISSSTSWGGQLYDDFINRLNGFGEEFAGPGDKDVDSGARTEAFETRTSITNGGFFAQQQFGWNDQLFVTAGLRVDGHSAFGDDFGFAPYPKVSASYILSDNDFYPETWGTLKLRAAYGESGKAPGTFDAVKTWDPVAGDDGRPAVTPDNLGNPDLGPERTKEFEWGLEGSAWDGRVNFEYTYYNQKTVDALIAVQQTPSRGFTGTQLENVGDIKNWGHEAFLNVNVLNRDNFNLDMGGRYSTNKSEVLDLGGLTSIDLGWRNFVRPGQPLPVFCHNVVQNGDEVGAIPIMEEDCLGPTYPTHTYGLNASLTFFRRLTFDILGEGMGGHVLSSGTAYQNTRRSVWPPCAEIQAAIKAGNTANLTARDRALCDTKYVTYGMWANDASFFKIRSASLGFRVPESVLPGRIRSATLRLQGRNLGTWTDFVGPDPETFEDGSSENLFRQEYYNIPPIRSFILSLKIDF